MIRPCGDGGRYRKYGKVYDITKSNPNGSWHTGMDFDVPEGTEIKAICSGKVLNVYTDLMGFGSLNPSTKGTCILVQHYDTVVYYGHVNAKVVAGQDVTSDTVIGTVAHFTSGGIYLPHLHMSVWNGLDFVLNQMGYRPVKEIKKDETGKEIKIVDIGKFIDVLKFLDSQGEVREQYIV